jgi:ATP-dependent DNA helicase RecQ
MKMNNILSLLEEVLKDNIEPETGALKIRDLLKNENNQRIVSQGSCAYRACRSLYEIKKQSSTWYDFLGHLRQSIVFFNRNFILSENIAVNVRSICDKFGIFVDSSTNEANEINNFPHWFNDSDYLKNVYSLKSRRDTKSVIGDGILYKMSGFKRYSTSAQKTIIRASMKMPEGSTLLACLPTGGGKSLVSQLPAYYETQGGRLGGSIEGTGVTIVVVPTVALAIDQATSARKYFGNAKDETHIPWAYYGDMDENKKKLVREELINGTIPLLYTSPEAIINGAFSNILLECARHNKISRLVIDEAHIVVDWGASFRTEFQLLAIFRRKILKESKNKIKTILLSATLTDNTVDVLKKLFSEDNNFIEIRSDSLRPEPMFWLFQNSTIEKREEQILEILPLLPRPIILYVTSPPIAYMWKNKILSQKFSSVETFTGKTSGNEREDIIDKWNDDKIDIIVATSAFGMGVDKSDIRTIIHCCMPESLNRYYQEVGRGGRDGFPSISILSSVPLKDYNETFNLINKKVLKADTIADRWESMLNHPRERVSGDSIWINTDIRRTKLQDQNTGQQNADWNTATLLFLYRKGLLDILDVNYDISECRHHILVKLKDINVLENKDELIKCIEPLRDLDWKFALKEYNDMKELTSNFDNRCWAEFFSDVYTLTQEKCSGCPKCRKDGQAFYDLEGENQPDFKGEKIYKFERGNITGIIGNLIKYEKELFLSYSSGIVNKHKFIEILNKLIEIGVNNIIIPNYLDLYNEILERITGNNCPLYYLFEQSEILKEDSNHFINGITAVFYIGDKIENDNLYKWTQKYIAKNENNFIIHIADDNIIIPSENAILKNKIKLYYGSESLINQMVEQEEEDLF